MTSSAKTIPLATRRPLADLRVILKTWVTLALTRKTLSRLTPEQCRDIGVSPIDAKTEAAQPFWKA